MATPKVSVIMSVYNEPLEWVQLSIDSILHQTYTDFEFIIINDNPANKPLKPFLSENQEKDGRIVIINNENNIGLTKSLNVGLENARGEYIARMDADDISRIDRFKLQVDFLDNHKEIGVCGSNINYFGRYEKPVKYPETMKDMFFILDSPFAHPTVMFRKDILGGKGYDENCKVSQDYALWARLYKEGVQFYNIQQPLLEYRISNSQISTQKKALQTDIAKSIRRGIMNFELQKAGHEPVTAEQMTWKDVAHLKKIFNEPTYLKREFLYYMYLSVEASTVSKLLHLLFTLDFMSISLKNTARIIYYNMKGLVMYKY